MCKRGRRGFYEIKSGPHGVLNRAERCHVYLYSSRTGDRTRDNILAMRQRVVNQKKKNRGVTN